MEENDTTNNQGKILNVKTSNISIVKKFLLCATIICLSLSALIGIFIILLNPRDISVYRIIGTTTIFGILALITTNNVFRLESGSAAIRKMSIAAIISNLCWAIILLCLVWGVFDFMYEKCDYVSSCLQDYFNFMKVILKILSISITTSISFSIITNFLSFRRYVSAINILSITGIICTAIIAFRSVVTTLSDKYDLLFTADVAWRFYAILLIILVFCLVVAAVLSKVQGNKEKEKKLQESLNENKTNEAELRARLEKEIRAEIAEEQKNNTNPEQDSSANS